MMWLNRLLKDRNGNVVPMFALALIPILGFVGAAVDYSRANSIKASLQASLDATALAMAKLAPTLTQGELQTRATAYFTAQFNKSDAKNLTINVNYTTAGGSQLTLTSSATMDTAFMKIMGYPTLGIGSSTTVKWGNNRLRVALALDNTGSMASSGKMTALKSATKNMLDQLKDAATNSADVYVSIIPFSKNVNAGSSNRNAAWLNWTLWDTMNKVCNGWVFNGLCYSWSGLISFTPLDPNNWNGCVTDRDQPYDASGSDPLLDVLTKFLPEQYDSCPIAVKGLANNWGSLKNTVDQMSPAGSTNQTIGLVWAWMSLTGGGPFTVPSKDPNYQYQQAIVLMSDGLNTQNRWDGNGSSVSTAVDARMALACTAAKAAGLTIYTVHVNTDGDPTSQVLKNCATSSSYFFTVTSSGDINTVFNQIGTQLSQLRISK
jgi:Flp pilus assembly protein TadG